MLRKMVGSGAAGSSATGAKTRREFAAAMSELLVLKSIAYAVGTALGDTVVMGPVVARARMIDNLPKYADNAVTIRKTQKSASQG